MVKPPEPPRGCFGPILAVTVATADLAASVSAYRSGFGYRVMSRGQVTAAEALAWGAEVMAGRSWALVGSDPSRAGAVRLVETSRPDGYRPLRHLGWAALEISVSDVTAVADRVEEAGFRVLRRPAPLASSALLRAMQVVGPSGEVIYLTQRLGPLPGFDLPEPAVLADRVFIAVLASADLPTSRSFYEASLGAVRKSDRRVAIRVLNDAFGIPEQTEHRLSTVQLAGQSLIEIDQYPCQATPQPRAPGELPWGVGLVTLAEPEPTAALPQHDHAPVATWSAVALPPGNSQAWPSANRRYLTGAGGELLELVTWPQQVIAGSPAALTPRNGHR
jgi:catechol 2,3-dioxygenase-like lactoylglutathione lyase family enzyme